MAEDSLKLGSLQTVLRRAVCASTDKVDSTINIGDGVQKTNKQFPPPPLPPSKQLKFKSDSFAH